MNSASSPFPACDAQINELCIVEGKPLAEAREIFQCLRKNSEKLSGTCQQNLERYVQASRQAAARGGGALGSFGGFTALTPPVPLATYDGRISPKGPGLYENKISLSSPVLSGERSVTSMSVSAGDLHFNEPIIMTTGQTLPRDLYRAEVGAQYSLRLADKKSFGLRVSVGSTGDQVFQSMNDANFSFGMTYGFPGSARNDYWVALLFFANNSVLGDYIPIPGIIYIHKTEHFTGVFGFPVLSLQWTPTSDWSYSLSVLATTLIAEAAYGNVTGSQYFVQGSFNQQRYILHDRVNDRDRLTFQERRVGVGYRTPLFSSAYGEVQAGRAFGRSLYIGDKILKTDGGLSDLEDSSFVNASVKFVF